MSKKFKLRTVFDRCLLKSHIAHWAALRFLDSDTRTLKRSHESSEPPTHDPNFVRLEFLNFTQFSSSRPHRRRRATENLEKISIHIVTRWRNSRIMIISECYDHRLTNSPLEAFHEHFSLLRCELWRKKISRRSGGKELQNHFMNKSRNVFSCGSQWRPPRLLTSSVRGRAA